MALTRTNWPARLGDSSGAPALMESPTLSASTIARALPGVLSVQEWEWVVASMAFSPQQARIVSLILDGKSDKQIAHQMQVTIPTIRTYLTRLFQRTGAADRIELILRVFACAKAHRDREGCHQK